MLLMPLRGEVSPEMLCGVDSKRRAERRLEGGEDNGNDEKAEEEASAVGDGVDDGVLIELAARGLEPEPHYPEEKDGNEKPEASGVLVELCSVQGRDVKGKDDDRGKATC